MSGYSELIKNFGKMREIMREFYVYGFKSREQYSKKSARSYDDERRRLESWLGDYMGFVRTAQGKNVFISIDSRILSHNPFYRALKSKSFTDGDITLHFILFDILHSELSLPEILEKIDSYLSGFEKPMEFDESTVRKKLKEYESEGLIVTRKEGRRMLYKRAEDTPLPEISDLLHFYSEVAPCGVIGSFIADKYAPVKENFRFKHHYITSAIDSDVVAALFDAISKKSIITVKNLSRSRREPRENKIIPLRIFISVQNGRQHLLAYNPDFNEIRSFRIDYLSDVKIVEPSPRFDELRLLLDEMQKKMWGVIVKQNNLSDQKCEHVDFTVRAEDGEEHIIQRLMREKRTGQVTEVDSHTYRFTADVYDINEMIPWIRTFICRITSLHFSNRELEKQFKNDINRMYGIYGIEEENI